MKSLKQPAFARSFGSARKTIKQDFTLLRQQKNLSYLDSAATSLTPDVVVKKMDEYYFKYNANVHRGVYSLAQKADEEFERARVVIADFINANSKEVIFTSGATAGLNILASSIGQTLKKGDNVVLTRMEHHANLVPWQQAAKRYGFAIRFIELNSKYQLDLKSAKKVIDKNTKVVSIIHVSNTLGTVNPVFELIKLAKRVGAQTILDSSQAAAHLPIDVKKLDCDYLVFSGHKVYGPTGIGILYGKRERLVALEPVTFGGDMIISVSYEAAEWNEVPYKFEAGTPNIAGAIGLGMAVEYIQSIGWKNILKHENELTQKALKMLTRIKCVKIIGPAEDRVGVISFVVDGVHPHDLASILDGKGVAVRAGHHCTMPLMKLLGVRATARASFGIYSTQKDIVALVEGIKKAQVMFRNSF